MKFIIKLLISIISPFILYKYYGNKMILILKNYKVYDLERNHSIFKKKKKKVTMGGIYIIIIYTLISLIILKINDINNIILLISLINMGIIGFIDDYIKSILKHKPGLNWKIKILSQIILGIIIYIINKKYNNYILFNNYNFNNNLINNNKIFNYIFDFKKNIIYNNNITYLLLCIIIIIFSSNSANIIDGIDGMATTIYILMLITYIITLIIYKYNIINTYYFIINKINLNIIDNHIICISTLLSILLCFLKYNKYPAKIYLGDTGSLSIGGFIGSLFIINKQEIYFPFTIGIIFLIEIVSIIIQIFYFKITKKIFLKGKRIFLMAPLHHHFQIKKYSNKKIILYFSILQIIFSTIYIYITI